MGEIKDIPIASIDPQSTVNVRRSQIEEGVERVKPSIKEHGFWRTNPITIRPHPDRSSQYKYEVVVGQCRFKACSELGIKQIPAVIDDIDDDKAIALSWGENESRSNLTMRDKAHWVKRITMKYVKEGKNKGEARNLAAKFLGLSVQTIINYEPLAVLPEDVAKMMDDGSLRLEDAKAIVGSCVGAQNEELDEKIRERAKWIVPMDKRQKEGAVRVLKAVGPKASIGELDKELEEKVKTTTVEVAIPEVLRPKLLAWGETRGLPAGTSEAIIISHMITMMLSGK